MNRKEIERGIHKLEKRIRELNQILTVHLANELQLQCNETVKVIDETVASVFGRDTPEYNNYKIANLHPGIIVRPSNERERVNGYHRAIRNGISTLTAAVKEPVSRKACLSRPYYLHLRTRRRFSNTYQAARSSLHLEAW